MNSNKTFRCFLVLLAGFFTTSAAYADMVGTGREAPSAATTTVVDDDQSLIDTVIEWLTEEETETSGEE